MKKTKAKIKPKIQAKTMGRPSKTKAIDKDQLKALILRGFTDGEIALFFKISRSTYYKWLSDNPEFSDTIKEWEKEASTRVKRSLYESACGYSHLEEVIHYDKDLSKFMRTTTIKQYAPNATAMAIWLVNKCKGEFSREPEPEEDERFKNSELIFHSVPAKGRLDPKNMKYLQN